MNTASLKKFAPELRSKLMEAIAVKLDYVLTAKTPDYLTTFASQVAALRQIPLDKSRGAIYRAPTFGLVQNRKS